MPFHQVEPHMRPWASIVACHGCGRRHFRAKRIWYSPVTEAVAVALEELREVDQLLASIWEISALC